MGTKLKRSRDLSGLGVIVAEQRVRDPGARDAASGSDCFIDPVTSGVQVLRIARSATRKTCRHRLGQPGELPHS